MISERGQVVGRCPTPIEGSTPISSLHISRCQLKDIKKFIEDNHYSHSIFGLTGRLFYRVDLQGDLVGAALFGAPAGVGVAKKYDPHGRGLLELRRFVLDNSLPRNAESRVLGVILRDIRKQGDCSIVLSYADPSAGHKGTIYKAVGFTFRGVTNRRHHIMWKGKKYPDRNIHQVHFPYHLELRKALLDGTATYVEVPGKFIYTKELK